jgi:hypothetical protein
MIHRARRRALALLLILTALIVAALVTTGVMTGAELADKGIDAALGFALALRTVRL